MKRYYVGMWLLFNLGILFLLAVTSDAIALEETIRFSAMQAGARNNYVTTQYGSGYAYLTQTSGTANKYNVPAELWFSLPLKAGDVITEIGIAGPIPKTNTHYKKATLIEKHPGRYGIDLEIAFVQQNQGEEAIIKWNNLTDYTVPADKMVFMRVELYSSLEHANNQFTGILYKIQPAPTPAEEIRYVGAIHAGSRYRTFMQGGAYAYIIPQTSTSTGEVWFSLPVKKGDIIKELGISGPISGTGTVYKKATIIERHPGQISGTERASVQQNLTDYYMKWENIPDYTVPGARAILVRVDLVGGGGYSGGNTFTGLWYKVEPAAESGEQLKFLSPMHSGDNTEYPSTSDYIATQYTDRYAYASPSTANTKGEIWFQLPVKAGDVITDLGVSGLMSGTGTAYTTATLVEKEATQSTGIEISSVSVQQNLGDYYIKMSDIPYEIPYYTISDRKMILVRVEVYAGTGTKNAFTGLWWKMKKPEEGIAMAIEETQKELFAGSAIGSSAGTVTVTDIGAKYMGAGNEIPLTTNDYGTLKTLPAGLSNKLLYPTGYSHSIGGTEEIMLWDIDGNYYTTTGGATWDGPFQLKKADGIQIKPVVAYSHKVGGEWIVLWDKDGNFYSTNGDINKDGKYEWKTNINDWKTGTMDMDNDGYPEKPTLGYRHSLDSNNRDWAIFWVQSKYYSTRGDDSDNDGKYDWFNGDFASYFGDFVTGKNQTPVAEYSHNIGSEWLILFTGDGRFYATKSVQSPWTWNSGTITNYYGSNVLSSSNYNPSSGGTIAPVIGFSHHIGGAEEVVLITASADLYTTKDAQNWVFVDYDTDKVWYGVWK